MNKQLQNCAARTNSRQRPANFPKSVFSSNFLKTLLLGMMVLFWQEGSSGIVVITSDQTWDDVLDVPADVNEFGIQITNNAKLTIEGLEIRFYPDAGIFVYLGCQLILDHATLSLFNPTSNNHWKGINSNDPNLCDAFYEQFTTFPDHSVLDDIPAWEGVLRTGSNTSNAIIHMTDSKIERAKTGIFSKCGTIIRARGCEFVDCETGCWLAGYEDNLSPHVNASFFMDFTFKWTLPNSYYTQTNLIGLKLSGIKGINIGGCKFENARNVSTCPNERGTGIWARNAEFILSIISVLMTKVSIL